MWHATSEHFVLFALNVVYCYPRCLGWPTQWVSYFTLLFFLFSCSLRRLFAHAPTPLWPRLLRFKGFRRDCQQSISMYAIAASPPITVIVHGNEFIHSSVGCGFKWQKLSAACRIHGRLRHRQGCSLAGATFIVELCCCFYLNCYFVVVVAAAAMSGTQQIGDYVYSLFIFFHLLSISHAENAFVGRVMNEACPTNTVIFNWIGWIYFCTGFTA